MREFDYDFKTIITMAHNCLIITLPSEISDDEIELSSKRIVEKAHNTNVIGVILDLSMVAILDSYIFAFLERTSKIILLMGIKVVWIGLRPGVVSTLLDLNVDFREIKTALNLQEGLRLIMNLNLRRNRGSL